MKRSLLVVLLLGLPVGIAAFTLFGTGGRDPGRERLPVSERAEAPAPEAPVELVPPPVVRRATGEASTTVLWPLKVELELVEARYLPKMEGVPPIGSGAAARLSGQITGTSDQGVPAEIHFVAGANTGRVLLCDGDGRFGATDLYPGLSVVEVRGAATLGSRRELRLRRGQETLLNIGYGRPGSVLGKVQDSTGKGLDGAAVVVDGTRVLTDADGGFFLNAVAAGQVLVEVEKEGYAYYQELVWVAGGAQTSGERMTFTLKPAAEMRIAIAGAAGPEPTRVFLFSDRPEYTAGSAYRNESFPWHKINPVEVWPGQTVTVGNLRPEIVKVHAFRAGARAKPKVVNLAANMRDVLIEMQPAPTLTGKVMQDGVPIANATVKLEAPDRVRAMLGYFTEPSYFLETAVMPHLPPGIQETKSGKDGRFVLSAWSDASPVRYLEAKSPLGGAFAGRFVRPEDTDVVLELGTVQIGESTLVLDFPGRHQGLPVEVWIGGAPTSAQVLAADEPLEVAKLVAGTWRIGITWRAQPILGPAEHALDDVLRLDVPLPPECIQGQDEEQWKRAGKEFPHGS